SRARLRRERGEATRRRHQGRRDGPEDFQGPRHVRAEGGREPSAGRRSGARSDLATCARLNVPVLIHIAEPAAFFDPLDYTNERWLELSLYPDRRHQQGVRFEQLMTERNA